MVLPVSSSLKKSLSRSSFHGFLKVKTLKDLFSWYSSKSNYQCYFSSLPYIKTLTESYLQQSFLSSLPLLFPQASKQTCNYSLNISSLLFSISFLSYSLCQQTQDYQSFLRVFPFVPTSSNSVSLISLVCCI